MCISHWAASDYAKAGAINKRISGLKVKCIEMPNASYTYRSGTFSFR